MSATDQRQHAVAAMTTYELSAYRASLEAGLAVVTEDEATRAVLQERLTEVLTEQDERARIRANG